MTADEIYEELRREFEARTLDETEQFNVYKTDHVSAEKFAQWEAATDQEARESQTIDEDQSGTSNADADRLALMRSTDPADDARANQLLQDLDRVTISTLDEAAVAEALAHVGEVAHGDSLRDAAEIEQALREKTLSLANAELFHEAVFRVRAAGPDDTEESRHLAAVLAVIEAGMPELPLRRPGAAQYKEWTDPDGRLHIERGGETIATYDQEALAAFDLTEAGTRPENYGLLIEEGRDGVEISPDEASELAKRDPGAWEDAAAANPEAFEKLARGESAWIAVPKVRSRG